MVMNPGKVFYEGNHASSKGLSIAYLPILDDLSLQQSREIDYHHAVYRRLARMSTGDGLTPVEVNRYWFTKALNFLRDNLGFSLRRALTKAFYFFHSYEWHDLLITYRNKPSVEIGRRAHSPIRRNFRLCGRRPRYPSQELARCTPLLRIDTQSASSFSVLLRFFKTARGRSPILHLLRL
jgi:hypothetical protein